MADTIRIKDLIRATGVKRDAAEALARAAESFRPRERRGKWTALTRTQFAVALVIDAIRQAGVAPLVASSMAHLKLPPEINTAEDIPKEWLPILIKPDGWSVANFGLADFADPPEDERPVVLINPRAVVAAGFAILDDPDARVPKREWPNFKVPEARHA